MYCDKLATRTLQFTLRCLAYWFATILWFFNSSAMTFYLKYLCLQQMLKMAPRANYLSTVFFKRSEKVIYLGLMFVTESVFCIAFSPAQTTVPPGIATSQVSLYSFSSISAIRKICWAMCDNLLTAKYWFLVLYLLPSVPTLLFTCLSASVFTSPLPFAIRWTWLL